MTLSPRTPAVAPLLTAEGLIKTYAGRAVVNGVSLEVAGGEIVGLLGPNGAGKTTTFGIVVGLVRPDAGVVRLGDSDLTDLPMYRRARAGICYLPQEPSVFRKMTVEENLLAILETLDLTRGERQERCDRLLAEFGLEPLRTHRAHTLSGASSFRRTSCSWTSRSPGSIPSPSSRSRASRDAWPLPASASSSPTITSARLCPSWTGLI